jgi:hypothetical protein
MAKKYLASLIKQCLKQDSSNNSYLWEIRMIRHYVQSNGYELKPFELQDKLDLMCKNKQVTCTYHYLDDSTYKLVQKEN